MRLKKYRGQHLLTDSNMLEKIVESADIKQDDNIIEIGAGTGLMTELLAQEAKRVVSFEIDRNFEEQLEQLKSQYQNLTIHVTDFMKWDMTEFFEKQGETFNATGEEPSTAHSNVCSTDDNEGRWRVIANIPYNITSPILEKLIEEGRDHLSDANILMQKEVAERIVAKPGKKDFGRLSVFVQYFCDAELLFTVPPTVFTPEPKIDSAVLSIKFKDQKNINTDRLFIKTFFKVVKAAFSLRRKQLHKAIRGTFTGNSSQEIKELIESAGIDCRRRGETLSIEEFEKLAEKFAELN